MSAFHLSTYSDEPPEDASPPLDRELPEQAKQRFVALEKEFHRGGTEIARLVSKNMAASVDARALLEAAHQNIISVVRERHGVRSTVNSALVIPSDTKSTSNKRTRASAEGKVMT